MGRGSRGDATQAHVIAVAKGVFAADGFIKASLAEIVEKAGVTTGAVYHHFGDKKGLFKAVAEHLEQEILDEVGKVPTGKEPWQAFETKILATLKICSRPDIQRIVFQEAPNVIGAAAWLEIEMRYAFGDMQKTIKSLAHEGLIHAPDPNLTAQILLGAVIQAAHGIAMSNSKAKALADVQSTVIRVVRALRTY